MEADPKSRLPYLVFQRHIFVQLFVSHDLRTNDLGILPLTKRALRAR